jgi:hypothetical protein
MRPAPRYDGERPYIYTYVKHFSKKRTRDVQIQKKASISYPDDLEFWIYCYTSIMDRGEVYGTPYICAQGVSNKCTYAGACSDVQKQQGPRYDARDGLPTNESTSMESTWAYIAAPIYMQPLNAMQLCIYITGYIYTSPELKPRQNL